ncbi:sperm flagellar protein 2 [Discoglossus pictus]
MSEIICQWLNDELKLSRRVEPKTFAKEFSNGYLIGEVLYRYQLQDDFDQFSQSRMASSKLNNFTRMEPTLQLLGIPFDQNMAQNIMAEQHGVATKLLYQMYIALQKKKKAGLTGVAMETLRPAAPAKLQSMGTEIYKERLKSMVPRQSDISLQQVSEQFQLKAKAMDEKIAQIQSDEQKRVQKLQEELRLQDIEKLRRAKKRQNEIMARIQAAIVQIPKPPPSRSLKAIEAQKIQRKKKEAEEVYTEISRFEKTLKKTGSSSSISPSTRSPTTPSVRTTSGIGTPLVRLDSTDDYLKKIQKRLEDDTIAREQRENRRRKVLVEQMTAHQAQEDALREEQLVNRLMRQSQQERRIAVQLMHVRHEKDILIQNRIFREKQYEERRQKDFQEALEREAAIQKNQKFLRAEDVRLAQEEHNQIAAERAEARYKKHYLMCEQIVNQIVDLVTKTGEYREITNRLIPVKLMREWKELFFTGYPLYGEAPVDPLPSEPTPEQILEMEKQVLIDEQDYEEYKTMTGEWIPQEDNSVTAPAPNNNILGHVVRRLFEIAYPPKPPTPPPVFPPFSLKGCVLGKVFSGKTTCLKHLAQGTVCGSHNIQIFNLETLQNEALQAYKEKEMETVMSGSEKEDANKEDDKLESSPITPNDIDTSNIDSISTTEKNDEAVNNISPHPPMTSTLHAEDLPKLSTRAQLGEMTYKILIKGKLVPCELLIEILVNAIKSIPPNTGWIVEDFPRTVTQAKLFEKVLTGRDPEEAATKSKESKMSSLVTDPTTPADPPPPPPAFDLAVLIDVSDNALIQRLAKNKVFNLSNTEELNGQDEYPSYNAMQDRITDFLDTWEELDVWFSEQNILVKVNGEVEEDRLCKDVEEVFLNAIYNKQEKVKEAEKKEEIPSPSPPVTPPAATPPPATPAPATPPEGTESDKEQPPSSPKQKSANKGRETSKSPKGSPRGRSSTNTSRPTTAGPEPDGSVPEGPPPPEPGTTEWVYINEPLPQEVPEYLVACWETVENNYENTIKCVLRSVRQEQLIVIHYLFDVRNRFKDYLKIPDHMQEFVTQWQADFSSTEEDTWDDEEKKSDLHEKVDNLRDCLWDISDKKKDEAEQERIDLMNEGWLQDHTGILVNHFLSLMQVEVDRFQGTMRLLHDYYKGMEGKSPSETTIEFTRIPLLDITNTNLSGESETPKRIPLTPRKAVSSEQNVSKQKSKTTPPVKVKEDQSAESSRHTSETDEKQIMDNWHNAVSAIENMLASEVQMRDAEEEEERQMIEMKEKERLKAPKAASQGSGKEAKKKAPKSPNKKKGDKSPGPEPPEPSVPTEDILELQKKQELKLKMKQEYFAAVHLEEEATKSRLELIKCKALDICQDIVSKSEFAYKDMEMWLGARFLAEMASIERLVQIARDHIERKTKLERELVLEKTDFCIDSDVKVIPDPIPPPRPPSMEIPSNAILTMDQLEKLYRNFLSISPKDIIPDELFGHLFGNLTSLPKKKTESTDLPPMWLGLTESEVDKIMSAISPNSEMVDWRKILLSVSLPWPYPSVSQLLKTLHRFKAADYSACGTVTQESYEQVDLWFTGKVNEYVPQNPSEPLPFNRLEHLIKFFFFLFADPQTNPPQLDYADMLLYFAAHPDTTEGVFRALSIANDKLIQDKAEDNFLVKSFPTMDALSQSDGHIIESEDKVLPTSEEMTTTLQALLTVFKHQSKIADPKRISPNQQVSDYYNQVITHIFTELSTENLEPVAVKSLMKHPVFKDLVDTCQFYKLTNIHELVYEIQQAKSSEGENLLSTSEKPLENK